MALINEPEERPIYFGASAELLKLAGDLRHSMSKAERLLWAQLRNRKIDGFRFRRQLPIGDFIVDFFCYDKKVAIEVDGGVHNNQSQAERDIERTRMLNKLGIEVIRFKNLEVETQIDQVIEVIRKSLNH